jgi:hypothetical protein
MRRLRHRGAEGDPVIILPRSQVAHLASCGHWVCLHDKVAQVGDREICGLCALTAADSTEQLRGCLQVEQQAARDQVGIGRDQLRAGERRPDGPQPWPHGQLRYQRSLEDAPEPCELAEPGGRGEPEQGAAGYDTPAAQLAERARCQHPRAAAV